MGQLTFFSADLLPPVVADLGGLLAASGQVTSSGSGSRLSMLLVDESRAIALAAESEARGIRAVVTEVEGPGPTYLVRTERTQVLTELAREWTRGAVKSAPSGLEVSAGFLRMWALAAGRMDDVGYLLGLDPHAPDNVEGLIAACARAGIAGSYIGTRGGGPGIRVIGHRRLSRLIDTVGTLPAGLPDDCYPVEPQAAMPLQRQF